MENPKSTNAYLLEVAKQFVDKGTTPPENSQQAIKLAYDLILQGYAVTEETIEELSHLGTDSV